MTSLTIAVMAFAGFAIAYMMSTAGLKSKARWLGLAAIICAMPCAFFIGSVTAQFDANVCYAGVIDRVMTAIALNPDTNKITTHMQSLPISGYETDCGEVALAVDKWIDESKKNIPAIPKSAQTMQR